MQGFKAHLENGRIVADEAVNLPDGTLLRVVPVDELDDEMSAEERAELLRSIDEGLADVDAGDVHDFKTVVASLGKRT